MRKQREIALAQEQLREMATLSHNVNEKFSEKKNIYIYSFVLSKVVHDLKTARQRQTIAKRETKGLEQKIENLTRKLYKLTTETQHAEEHYKKAATHAQLMDKEQTKLDKVFIQ